MDTEIPRRHREGRGRDWSDGPTSQRMLRAAGGHLRPGETGNILPESQE